MKNITITPYGWANEDAVKNDSVIYEISGGNVVWDIVGIETVIIPVYLTGWKLYQPVMLKKDK